MKTSRTFKGIERRETPFLASLRLRQTDDGGESRTIEGMAIVFGKPSVPMYEDDELVIREEISPKAVTKELLDSSDILATLYHNNERILARSLNGSGTLSYEVTDAGVNFRFEPPETEDGKTALNLVKRGDITGCSFAFGVDLGDKEAQTRTVKTENGKRVVTYTVNKIAWIRDITLTPRPAYRDTKVATRLRDLESGDDSKENAADWLTEVERIRSISEKY